jgi:hypothetical protein
MLHRDAHPQTAEHGHAEASRSGKSGKADGDVDLVRHCDIDLKA